MSNYLNQLVAKNLNLIDTVQPFVLSVFGFFPESPIEISSEESWGINSTPNTQLFSSSSASEQLTQKESETIFSPSIAQTQPTTEPKGQQPVKIHETVFPSQSQKVVSSKPSVMPLSEVGAVEPISHKTSNQILPTKEEQQLIPASMVGTNISIADMEVEQLTQKATEPNGQQPVKSNETVFPPQSQKVVSSKPLPMSLSEVGAVEPISNKTSNQILPTKQGQQLIPAQVLETNTSIAHMEVEQVRDFQKLNSPSCGAGVLARPSLEQAPWMPAPQENFVDFFIWKSLTQKATEPNRQQPVKGDETVSPPQLQKVVSSKPLPMPLSEVGAIEPIPNKTSNQILPTKQGQQLIPALVVETNTSVAYPEVEQVTQKATELNGQQPVKIHETVFPSQLQKIVSSKPLAMPLSEVGAVEPISNQTSNRVSNQTSNQILPTKQGQQLIPAPVVETNTSFAYPEVEQVTQKATELNGQQPVKIHETVFPLQLQKVVSSKSLPMPLSEVGAIEPISNKTSNQVLSTEQGQKLYSQGVRNSLLNKRQNSTDATLQEKLRFTFLSMTEDASIIQPLNNDVHRGAVFVSASRQEPQQRELSGNSTTPPTVQVSIGRMEIRTSQPPPPPPRPKPRPKLPVMSLDEYLRQRSRGR